MKTLLAAVVQQVKSRRTRAVAATLALLAGATFLANWTHQFTPIQSWLAWRYLAYWLCAGCLFFSCVAFGSRLMELLFRRYFGLGEHFVYSAAVGLLGFSLLWFVLGLLQLYSLVTFVLVPLSLTALGAAPLRRWRRRYGRHARLFRAAPRSRPTWLSIALVAYGVLALGLLYFTIITPDNIAYDARWYHLATAERYAVVGGIKPFAEGWFVGSYPQLATWVYSFAFLAPSAHAFDKIELAAHIEFVLFLFSVFSIPVVVRRVIGGRHQPLAWVARLLFPGVFLYDSSLAGGADHVAALWAIPVFLSFLRAFPSLDLRACLLFSCCAAGAVLTKYSVVGMVVFPGLALVTRALVLTFRERRRSLSALRPFGSLAATLSVGLLLTSAHWLKNWIWYHNPVYPLLFRTFASRPWTVDSPDRFGHFMPVEWSAPHTWAGALATLKATLTFSFIPNDWDMFHGKVPVFGSLLTLSLPLLLFIRPRKRLFALLACTHVAIAVWYWMFHQDRYLQSYLPWMGAAVACIGIEVWRLGLAPRLAAVALVALQLAWGGDTPFIPGHAMSGGTPLTPAIRLLSSSYRKDFEQRLEVYPPMEQIKQHVRKGGALLIHEQHLHLGIGVPVVSDWIGWQGGISYVRTAKPSSMYREFSRMGVSDVLWSATSKGYDSVGGDLAFYFFLANYTQRTTALGGQTLSRLTEHAPSDADFRDSALFLGCGDTYENGVYRLTDLSVTVLAVPRRRGDFPPPREPLPPSPSLGELLDRVDAVAINPRCFTSLGPLAPHGLQQWAERQGLELWVRSPEERHGPPRRKRK